MILYAVLQVQALGEYINFFPHLSVPCWISSANAVVWLALKPNFELNGLISLFYNISETMLLEMIIY